MNKEPQGIVLINADGPLRKLNASQSLGYIATVTAATAEDVEKAGKSSDYEAIIVSHNHACKLFMVLFTSMVSFQLTLLPCMCIILECIRKSVIISISFWV